MFCSTFEENLVLFCLHNICACADICLSVCVCACVGCNLQLRQENKTPSTMGGGGVVDGHIMDLIIVYKLPFNVSIIIM